MTEKQKPKPATAAEALSKAFKVTEKKEKPTSKA